MAESTIPPADAMPSEEEPHNTSNNPSADGGEPSNEAVRPTQPRFQLRAAINSVYQPTRPTQPLPARPAPNEPPSPNPAELERAAQLESLMAKGQLMARQGQLDSARQAFGEVIRRDPQNSEAWTWLGGLLIESQPQRAQECLQRAVELDPTNERARRGLAQATARLTPPEPAPVVEEVQPETPTEAELKAAQEPEAEIEPARPLVKIGIEEAVETLRQSGFDARPEEIPMGGARIRPAVEKGELKLPKRPHRQVSDLKRSMIVLIFMVLLCVAGVGLAILRDILNAPLSPENLTATAMPPVDTPVPMTNDEVFATSLRSEIDQYNRFMGEARNLRQQVQHGKLAWNDYRQSVRDLQGKIRTEKKTLDNLAFNATAKLTTYYRNLQTVASVCGQAIDFTVSGADNTNPDDLEEGNRQFGQAASLLVELNRNLSQASPIPTPIPTATPRPTPTSADLTPGDTTAPLTPAPDQTVTIDQPGNTPAAPVTTVVSTAAGDITTSTVTTPAATTPNISDTTAPATIANPTTAAPTTATP